MRTINKILFFAVALGLASCGAKTSNDKNSLEQKKAKLEQLKKQQDDLTKQIADLQAEIIKEDPSANPEKAKLVAVTSLQPQSFNHYIDLQGKVDADNISYAMPRGQGGQVIAVYVKEGDYVKKGQLLLKLDDAVLKQQLQQAESQLNYATDLYNRRNNLWKENIGTEVDLVTAKNNMNQAQKQVDIIKEQWQNTNVYAETNGIADQVTIHVGETFPSTTGFIKLVNNTDLKVTAEVPENYLGKVKVGSAVKIVFPDINDSITSRITVSGKVIDPNSRSFEIEAKLPSKAQYKPNQLALVKILDYSAKNTITVPVNTLQTDEQGKYVLVAVNENGKMYAKKKHVEVGELYGDRVEIKTGLAEGDALITDGYQNLYDGQLITTTAS